MARERRDRTQAIQAAVDNRGKYTGSRKGFTKSEDDLKESGVGKYVCDSGKNNTVKEHYLHVIPPHSKDGDPLAFKLFVHFEVGLDDDAYICPKQQKVVFEEYGLEVPDAIADGRCPICERWAALRKVKFAEQGDSKDTETLDNELKGLSCYPPRYLMWVVDASSEQTEDEGVQAYVAPTTVFDGMMDQCKKTRKRPVRDISDPEKGSIFTFSKEGVKFSTRYTAFGTEDRDPIPEEWEVVPRYVDVLELASYDDIAKAFENVPVRSKEDAETVREELADEFRGKDEEPAEDEAPPRRRRRQTTEKRVEDEAPPRRRRGSVETPKDDPPNDDIPPSDSDVAEIRDRVKRSRRGTE